MLDDACVCQSTHRHARAGLNAAPIARALTLDPRTVAYWLAQAHFRPRTLRTRHSTLAPCKPELVRLLQRSPSSAAQGFQRLRAHGFAGGSSLAKASVRTVTPRRSPAVLTLACAPGECAQGAWGACGSVPLGHTSRQRSCCVMVLCYSRLL